MLAHPISIKVGGRFKEFVDLLLQEAGLLVEGGEGGKEFVGGGGGGTEEE